MIDCSYNLEYLYNFHCNCKVKIICKGFILNARYLEDCMNRYVFSMCCLLVITFALFSGTGVCDTGKVTNYVETIKPAQKPGDALTDAEKIDLLREKADQGEPAAQFRLGVMYETGEYPAIPKSLKKAAEYYEKAADQGYMPAKNKMAVIYYHGLAGYEKDVTKSIALFKEAADSGRADSRFMLGSLYLKGVEGLDKDVKEGTRLIYTAALKGNEMAMDELGVMYFNGTEEIKRDRGKAYMWYKRAAGKGYAPAMVHIGSMYYYGIQPVDKDEDKGIEWVEKAANSGDEYAYNLLVEWGGGQEVEKTVTLELKKGGNINLDNAPEETDQEPEEDITPDDTATGTDD